MNDTETAPSIQEIDALVMRLLDEVGRAYWGRTLGLFQKKYMVWGRLYSHEGYWWVEGKGKGGHKYHWDVLYDGRIRRFSVGHTRGLTRTEGLSEQELKATLKQAMELGPIQQVPDSGYMGP
ncbi:MAG: hypothetical protein ACRDIB_16615 [Ardenticatenaceae bacterium]